jgi:octaprenyl-diphosphate synthase
MDIESWEEFREIDRALASFIDGIDEKNQVKKVVSHVCNAGGKKIRPVMLLLSAQLCGVGIRKCLDAGLAIELIHSASLIHDDLLDMGTMRRGIETANKKFGIGAAMLAGDFLISKSIELLSPYDKDVIAEFGRAGMQMAEGEVLDIEDMEGKPSSEEQYFDCIRKKTASLFAASTAMGAYVGKAEKETVSELRKYGEKVGIAYQIVDDLLEYTKKLEDKHSVHSSASLVEIYIGRAEPEKAQNMVEVRVRKEIGEARQILNMFEDSATRDKLLRITEYATYGMFP